MGVIGCTIVVIIHILCRPPRRSCHTRTFLRRQRFDEITRAYEILGDDRTRFLYQRYGFDDVGRYDDAIQSLLLGTGGGGGGVGGGLHSSSMTMPSPVHDYDYDDDDEEHESCRRLRRSRLLELMGHPPKTMTATHQRQRLEYLVDAIVKLIRPMVEDTISQAAFRERRASGNATRPEQHGTNGNVD